MRNIDMMIESPKISDLKENLNQIVSFFNELKESEEEGLEKADLIEALIQSAQTELQKAKGFKSIDELPIQQQARLFADLFCLEELFFEEEEDLDEEQFEDEEGFDEEEFLLENEEEQ